MENNTNNTTLAACEEQRKNPIAACEERRKNPIKRAFSAVAAGCKKIALTVTTMLTMSMMTTISAFATSGGGSSGGGGGGSVDGEAAFKEVVGFFADWIGKIGLVVAFVGGVMFALAIKNDDADAKTRGLMTLNPRQRRRQKQRKWRQRLLPPPQRQWREQWQRSRDS